MCLSSWSTQEAVANCQRLPMYSREDFQASLLFTALFAGTCMVPGALIGIATGLYGVWIGLQSNSSLALLGILALIFGPPFTALTFAVLSMGVTFLSGLVFFSVSPLLREAIFRRSRW